MLSPHKEKDRRKGKSRDPKQVPWAHARGAVSGQPRKARATDWVTGLGLDTPRLWGLTDPRPSVSSSVKWRTPPGCEEGDPGRMSPLWSEAGSLEQRGSVGIRGRPCRAGLPLGSGATCSGATSSERGVAGAGLPGRTLAVHTAHSIRFASDTRARSAVTVNAAGVWVTGRAATSRGAIGAGGP